MTPEQWIEFAKAAAPAVGPFIVGFFTLTAVSIPLWLNYQTRKVQLKADLAKQRAEWKQKHRAQREDTIRERLSLLIETYYSADNPDTREPTHEQRQLLQQRLYELMVVAPTSTYDALKQAKATRPFALQGTIEAVQRALEREADSEPG